MKINRLFPLFFGLAALLTSCGEEGGGGDGKPEGGGNDSVAVEPSGPEGIPFDPDAVYLDRMYATSTGADAAANLLDGDANTFWSAMPGAGQDEGVMLYFEAPTFVQKVRLANAQGGSAVEELGLYVNGSEVGTTTPDGEIEVAADVTSLFVRVTAVSGASKDVGTGPEGGDIEVVKFPTDLKTRLGEIELFGTGGAPMKVRPLHLEPGSISASSVLSPPEAYNADFLFDSRLEFGWAEGKEDEGLGESITFNFDKEMKIERLKVWNGYQRSDDHFEKNARVENFSFGLAGADAPTYQLGDQQAPTIIDLDAPLVGKSFELKVLSAYAGSKYKDLLLSELRFFDGQQWFGLESGGEEARKTALQERVAGTVLDGLLDRNLSYTEEQGWSGTTFTIRLILRSNGSFVLYKDFEGEMDQSFKKLKEVADGNWSIQELGGGLARVKVFGKLHRIMEKDLVYKGRKNKIGKRIYSEILTIYPDMIEGQKMIETMYLKVPD